MKILYVIKAFASNTGGVENHLFNLINQLKDNYKVALTLNLIEGYDYEEISDIMKISYQNSRTMISRAKSKLRELIVVNYER